MYGHKFTFYLKFDGVFYLTGLRENIGIIEKKYVVLVTGRNLNAAVKRKIKFQLRISSRDIDFNCIVKFKETF